MNCCNDAGHCTGGHGCAVRATRINTRTDAPANGIHFAPGAIEHHVRPFIGNATQRRELSRWLRLLGAAVALCAAAAGGGLLAGEVIRLIQGA